MNKHKKGIGVMKIKNTITHFLKMIIRCLIGSVGLLLAITYTPWWFYSVTMSPINPNFEAGLLAILGYILLIIFVGGIK